MDEPVVTHIAFVVDYIYIHSIQEPRSNRTIVIMFYNFLVTGDHRVPYSIYGYQIEYNRIYESYVKWKLING